MRTRVRLGSLLLGTGLLAVACGSMGPTPTAPAPTGFRTQQVIGGYGPAGCGYGNPSCAYGVWGSGINPYANGGLSPYTYGWGNVPVANDIFGGTTFLTDWRRFDRQPASLPYGVAEENDVAYRPLGSAIWQPK